MKNRSLLVDTFLFVPHLTEDANGRLIAKGEFARANVPTANGRVYKPSIWERNLKKLSESIKKNSLYGELDHPCLTSDDFRVLTIEGWKDFGDIKKGDRVWSRVNGEAIVSVVEGVVDESYSGPVFHVTGRGIDAEFTPAHKFLFIERPDRSDDNRSEDYATIAEIAQECQKYSHSAIPKTAKWNSENIQSFVIPGIKSDYINKYKNDVSQDLHLDPILFAGFLGIYLAEGSLSTADDSYGIFIHQKTGWSTDFIWNNLLSKFPGELKWARHDRAFYLADARIYKYLEKLGNVYTKHIPKEVKCRDSEFLKELLFWFAVGDGRMVKTMDHHCSDETFKELNTSDLRYDADKVGTRQDLFSVSEQLIRDLHECVVRSGGCGTISRFDPFEDRVIEGRVIKKENQSTLFQLHISHSKNIWLDPRFLKIEETKHDGRIFCLETTHGNFYMEMKGKSFWTGNSDGKTQLKRISHLIKRLSFDGNVVYGEAEILDTPMGDILQKIAGSGASIGVSSRGVGSVARDMNGNEIVQEDYELITFDFVADPANSRSWPKFDRIPEENNADIKSNFSDRNESKKLEENKMSIKSVKELKEKFPEIYDEMVKEIKDCVEKDVKEKAEKEIKEKAKKKLKEDVRDLLKNEQDSIRAQIESKLLSDPSVAGAKTVLEGVVRLLRPYLLQEDAESLLRDKEGQIDELKANMDESTERLSETEEALDKMADVSKALGMQLFFEKTVNALSDKNVVESLRTHVGDPGKYESLDDLKHGIKEGLNVLKKNIIEKEKIKRDMDRRLKEDKGELMKLRKENEKIKKAMNESIDLANKLAIRSYLAESIGDDPRKKRIMKILENENIDTMEKADKRLAEVKRQIPVSSRYKEIRDSIVNRRGANDKILESRDDKKEQNILGVSLSELKQLSGF